MLEIRPAELSDLAALVALEAASFADPWSSRTLRLLLGEADALKSVSVATPTAGSETRAPFTYPVILIASEDGEDLGYAISRVVLDVWELQRIGVHPEVRRRGIGARLLDRVIELARDTGGSCLQLEARETNEPARALYRSRHFTANGRRPNYYGQGVDAILGILDLTAPAAAPEAPSKPEI